MSEIVKLNIFSDNLNNIREKENLSYTLFCDKDLFHDNIGISFFRCDFRGSKFINCNFYKNNLDRSDFIACVFQNVSFKNTQIAACEMKNCYFDNVVFSNKNYYNNTSIQECTFKNCRFESEQLLVNMKNCTFINCVFSNCSFERSTTEKLNFEKCSIYDTDLATMHAERHRFKECILKRVYIGIDYIFGYLFYNTNIEGMIILYHGEEVCLEKESSFAMYIKELWLQQRYYEFINANIIYGNFNCIPPALQKSLILSENKTNNIRTLDISDILDSICFYIENCILPYDCFVQVMNIIDTYDWSKFSNEEYIIYMSKCNKLNLVINMANFSDEFIRSAYDNVSTVTFHCKTDNYDEAYNVTSEVLSRICSLYGLGNDFTLVDKQKGSWILTFAVCSGIVLLLPKLVKCYADVFIEIKTKNTISKQLEKKLQNKNLKLTDLKTLSEIASNSNLVTSTDLNYEKINIPKLIDAIRIGL